MQKLRWNMQFQAQVDHPFRIERFHAHGLLLVQLQQQEPVFFVPERMSCHNFLSLYIFCKITTFRW
ncbi:Uncharacterised protein [Segatella copri]|nr:Uncharacterised protein [Segatella copri]